MSLLQEMQGFMQQVVDVIAAIIEVETMIIDREFKVVAGSGEAYCEVGKVYTESLTKQSLTTGKHLVVDNPRHNPLCKNCFKPQKNCRNSAVVVYPIASEEEIIGSICLSSVGERQRQQLMSNQEKLLNFIDKISRLIASAVQEKKMKGQVSLLAEQFETAINSVHEGIITIDNEGIITHINCSAKNMLSLTSDSYLGEHINKIFHDISLEKLLSRIDSLEQELFYTYRNRRTHFVAVIEPILIHNKLNGFVISFRNIKDYQRWASFITEERKAFTFDCIIGQSKPMLQIINKVKKVSLTNSTVLIRGESGTGKEVFARAIHAGSDRASEPFVTVNCAAIPESLLESELFGYEEGAFTGAKRGGKVGKFELAHGGTIFLDEIGDMPLHLQVKLLRVLETKCVEKVGGTISIPVNVRIIAATHRDLEKMIENNEFREDLYYRLNVIPVFLPPLRERQEDIPLFIEHFIKKNNIHFSKQVKGLTSEAKKILYSYRWPGNVRELENVIEYAMNMETTEYIQVENLPQRIINSSAVRIKNLEYKPKLQQVEEAAIREALSRFGESVVGKKQAAKYLGISLATLYRRLKHMDI